MEGAATFNIHPSTTYVGWLQQLPDDFEALQSDWETTGSDLHAGMLAWNDEVGSANGTRSKSESDQPETADCH